jgi:hypothetical protein
MSFTYEAGAGLWNEQFDIRRCRNYNNNNSNYLSKLSKHRWMLGISQIVSTHELKIKRTGSLMFCFLNSWYPYHSNVNNFKERHGGGGTSTLGLFLISFFGVCEFAVLSLYLTLSQSISPLECTLFQIDTQDLCLSKRATTFWCKFPTKRIVFHSQ